MKKIIFLCLIIPFSIQCNSLTKNLLHKEGEYRERYCTDINSSWCYYSTGLYYKSIKSYPKALNNFLKSIKFNIESPRIYFQIADSYFHLQNYELALSYSKKAIKYNQHYSKPYVLMYNSYINLNKYNDAALILEDLIKIKPELVNIHYIMGSLYYNKLQKYDKALDCFLNILNLAKIKVVESFYKEYANYYLGFLYYNKNQIKKSIKYLKSALRINPENLTIVNILTRILLDLYYIDEAEEYASNYLKRYPESNLLNSFIGRIYYLKSDIRAIKYLQKGMHGDSLIGLLSKSLYYELIKKDMEAQKGLETILKNFPTFISPHIALSRINLRKNNKEEAINELFTAGVLLYKAQLYFEAREVFLKILSINDKISEVYFFLGRIYEDIERFSLAIVHYKKANEKNSDIKLLVHIGYLYSLKDNLAEATKYYNKAIKLDPKNPKPYFYKSLIFSKKNQFILAEKLLKEAIKRQEENDTFHFYLAIILDRQNRLDEAIVSLKTAIKHNPKNSRAYNYLGYVYADRNINIDESIDLIQKAISIEPLNGAYFDSLGWAYYRKGDDKKALEKLLVAEDLLINEGKPDPVVYDHIGDIYLRIKDITKAIQYWEKSINLKNNIDIEKKITKYRNK